MKIASINNYNGSGDYDGFLFFNNKEDKEVGGDVPFRVPVPSSKVEGSSIVPFLITEIEFTSECAPDTSGMMRQSQSFVILATSTSFHSKQFKPYFTYISETPSEGPILRSCNPPSAIQKGFWYHQDSEQELNEEFWEQICAVLSNVPQLNELKLLLDQYGGNI